MIQDYPDGGKCVRIRTEKTETETTLPISEQALELCGEPSSGIVFKGLTLDDKVANLIQYFENLYNDERLGISSSGYDRLLVDLEESKQDLPQNFPAAGGECNEWSVPH